MKSYFQGIITGAVFVFSFFIFVGQTNTSLSKVDENWYRSKGWIQAIFDLEINLGKQIDAVSRLLSLEVNDIESDIKSLNERLSALEKK